MDKTRYGLLQLSGSEDAVVDIVFVHGIRGDRESNWTRKSNVFWPKILLPQSIPNARILTWGYDNTASGYAKKSGNIVTEELCRDLVATRVHKPDRPIIFVGHDLGAVFCANVIHLATISTKGDARYIADCVRGIIFLGMPNTDPGLTGLDRSGYMPFKLSPEDQLTIDLFELREARDLSVGWLRDAFSSREGLNAFGFYEQDDRDLYGKRYRQLYNQDIATLPDNCLSIPGNHVTMCKFDSSDEPGYIMIKWLLQKWIRELPEHTSGDPGDLTEPSSATNVPARDTFAELHMLHLLLGLSKEDDKGTSEDSKGLSKPLLSPETVRWLASKELLISIQQESLTISTAPLLESFTTSTTDPTSTGENWSLAEDDKPFLRKVDVPIRLYSAGTYEFLGYERGVSERLWNAFDPSTNPSFSLFEVSKEYLENNLPAESEYDWNSFMAKIGICDSLRNSILHSHLHNIRSTESYVTWLRTAFDIRWQELKGLNDDLLKVMKRTASTGERPTGSSAPSYDDGTKTERSQSSGHQDTAQPPSEQSSGEKEGHGPATAITSAPERNESQDQKITLWRGSTKTKIEEAISNGKLRVNKMLSLPGDFSGRTKVPYFATKRNTAALYGAFHASLSKIGTPPYLLKFQVRKQWLLDLQHRCLWAAGPGNQCQLGKSDCPQQGATEDLGDCSWEHVVFTCRNEDYTPSVLTNQELAIGHIAAFHDEEVKVMNSKAEIGAGKLIVGDEPAIQYAFLSEESQKGLQARASGVETERLGDPIVRICMDNCPGKPRVDHFRLIEDLCKACRVKVGGSKSESKKRKRSASP